jgi:hypothetical protein
LRAFFEGEDAEIPSFFVEMVRRELGDLWHWLPEGALAHDAQAYLKASRDGAPQVATSVAAALPQAKAAGADS